MPKDYKPVNDRTLSDVNRANRDAWDSGEFKHVADDGKFPGNANELHQATAQQHQEEFESNETRQQHRARTNIGRRGAGEEHSEREKKSIRHVAGSDVRHTPAEDESHQEYHTKKAAEGGEYVKKLLTTYGNKTSPSMTGNVAAEAASHGHKALSKSKANLKERKSEGTPKRNYFVVGRDVRHTPEGEQQLVRGGQVVSHHDESKKEMEGIAKQPESIKKVLAERKQEEQRRKYHNEPEHGEVKIKDKLVDVPGNWPGKHADVEAAQNSAERAGGAANFGPNIPGPPESKDSLHGGGKTRTERALEAPSEHPAQTTAEYEKIKYGGRMPTKAEREREREEHTDIKDEEPKKAVHLPRTSKRTWRRGEWS